jgi:putative copper export protein
VEIPIPNFYFMGIQFIHLLALSVWTGGIVIIGAIVAPTLFRRVKSRKTAGELMGEILRKFDRVSLFCAAALIVTGIIKYLSWENLTPWNLTRYVAILIMTAGGLYSALVISPRLHEWLSGSEKSVETASAATLSIPAQKGETKKEQVPRHDFNQLHHTSVRLMMMNFICGVIALLMA